MTKPQATTIMGKASAALLVAMLLLCGLIIFPAPAAHAAGEPAPNFTLADLGGKQYGIPAMRPANLLILYFFDAQSRPSQEGLASLDDYARQNKSTGVVIWGITHSSQQQVTDFIAAAKPSFPILIDTAGVGEHYAATRILPTMCIVGTDLKIIETIAGGGKTMNARLAKITAERVHPKPAAQAKEPPAGQSAQGSAPSTAPAKSPAGVSGGKHKTKAAAVTAAAKTTPKQEEVKPANAETAPPAPIQWGPVPQWQQNQQPGQQTKPGQTGQQPSQQQVQGQQAQPSQNAAPSSAKDGLFQRGDNTRK